MPAPLKLAYYLPQFHPIAENDQWWGQGFTEWTCLRRARRYFRDQTIRLPGELGYYDLVADPGVMEKQFSIAAQYGIDGFCIWDYWFGQGKMLLEKPKQLILENKLSVRYCFAWANHSWLNKRSGTLLQAQSYPGKQDYQAYFDSQLPHFLSDGYIKIDNRPLFVLFRPRDIPDIGLFLDLWHSRARAAGFAGMHFIGENCSPQWAQQVGLNGAADSGIPFRNTSFAEQVFEHLVRFRGLHPLGPIRYGYARLTRHLGDAADLQHPLFVPSVLTGWDSTIRHDRRGIFLHGTTPETFGAHVRDVFELCRSRGGDGVVLIKSWNEWAEGNFLEPDHLWGRQMLDTFRQTAESVFGHAQRGQANAA